MPANSSRASSSRMASTASSSSTTAAGSFVERFRQTNDLYRRRAIQFRNSLSLTAHARRRAAHLDLQVDIAKAVRCDQRQISVIPLPILDTEPSPLPQPVTLAVPETLNLPEPSPLSLEWVHEDSETVQTIPQSVGACSSSSSSSSEYEDAESNDADAEADAAAVDMGKIISRTTTGQDAVVSPIVRSQNRPSLRCVIPTIALNQPALADAEASPDSKFSPEAEWSSVSLASAASPSGLAIMQEYAAASGVTITVPRTKRELTPLDLPTDAANRLSWGCGEVDVADDVTGEAEPVSAASEGSQLSAQSLSASSSSSYSSGPATPDDTQENASGVRLMIRIKRSNTSMRSDSGLPSPEAHVEKRPKFERKAYVRQHASSKRPRSLNLVSGASSQSSPLTRCVSTGHARR